MRPFCYVREDSFLARRFCDLDELNAHFIQCLDQVANRRLHGTTGRNVIYHFTEERAALRPLLVGPYDPVLALERRISREGMISVGGNLYSVPDGTRRRPVDLQLTATEVRILEDGQLIAAQPVLDGRGKRYVAAGHRSSAPPRSAITSRHVIEPPRLRIGGHVIPRSLAIYDVIGRTLARQAQPR